MGWNGAAWGPIQDIQNERAGLTSGFYLMGAGEDGRAPTEELSCVKGWASVRRQNFNL